MNAVTYAETVLQVHEPWLEVQERLKEHSSASLRFLGSGEALRQTKQNLEDRDGELIAEERGKHPDMKPTDFTKHMKTVLVRDSGYQQILQRLRSLESDRALAEKQMKHAELGIVALSARLHELGGLLHFYAAAKAVEQEVVVGHRPHETTKTEN